MWTNIIVLVARAFFHARSPDNALAVIAIIRHLGGLEHGTFKVLGLASFESFLCVMQISMLLANDYLIFARLNVLARLRGMRFAAIVAAALLFYDIMLFGIFEKVDFIYFQL